LLEVGTGFHPELTGRENIFLNGAILGMRKAEIARKFDEIVEFSGCARYIDTPVKRYSSGMYVRLAFAVAAHLEPEILIVDEVLAVGDAEFQKKCLGKMKDVASHGRTILFVSHNMAAVKKLCQNIMVLNNGTIDSILPSNIAIQRYSEINNNDKIINKKNLNNIQIKNAYFCDQNGNKIDKLSNNNLVFVKVEIENPKIIPIGIDLAFFNDCNVKLWNWSHFRDRKTPIIDGPNFSIVYCFKIPEFRINEIQMHIGIVLHESLGKSDYIQHITDGISISVNVDGPDHYFEPTDSIVNVDVKENIIK
jgi:ABC-type multidrug transport system ATPase subunit